MDFSCQCFSYHRLLTLNYMLKINNIQNLGVSSYLFCLHWSCDMAPYQFDQVCCTIIALVPFLFKFIDLVISPHVDHDPAYSLFTQPTLWLNFNMKIKEAEPVSSLMLLILQEHSQLKGRLLTSPTTSVLQTSNSVNVIINICRVTWLPCTNWSLWWMICIKHDSRLPDPSETVTSN